jgi:tRNA A-37 threonylcarbamoyl transferase component Bud32
LLLFLSILFFNFFFFFFFSLLLVSMGLSDSKYWTLLVSPLTTVRDVLNELSRKIGATDSAGLCIYAERRREPLDSADTSTNATSNASNSKDNSSNHSSATDDASAESTADLCLLDDSEFIAAVMLGWGVFVTDNRFWIAQRQPVATTFWHDGADDKFFSFALAENTRAADVIQFVADRDRVEWDALQLVLERVSSTGSSLRKPKVDRQVLRSSDFLVTSARAVEREQNARARFVIEHRRRSANASITSSPTKSRTLGDLLRFRSARSGSTPAPAAPAESSAIVPPLKLDVNASKLIRAASANAVTHLGADGTVPAARSAAAAAAAAAAATTTSVVVVDSDGGTVIKKRRRRRRRSSRGEASRSSTASNSGASSPTHSPTHSSTATPSPASIADRVDLTQAARRPGVVFSSDPDVYWPERSSFDDTSPATSFAGSFGFQRNDSVTEDIAAIAAAAVAAQSGAAFSSSTGDRATTTSDHAASQELARIKSERIARLRNMRTPLRTIQARLRQHAKTLIAFVYVVGVRGDDLDRDEAAMIDSAPRALGRDPPSMSVSGNLDTVRRLSMVTSGRIAARTRGAVGAAAFDGDGYESASAATGETGGSTSSNDDDDDDDDSDDDLQGAGNSSEGATTPSLAPFARKSTEDDTDLDPRRGGAPPVVRTHSFVRFGNTVPLAERRASIDPILVSSSHTSDTRFTQASIELPNDSGMPNSTFHPIGLTVEVTLNENALSVVWSICSALCLPRWSEWGLFDSLKRIPDFEPVRSSDHSGDERRPWLAMRRLNNSAFTDRTSGEMMLRDSTGLSSVNSSRRSSNVSMATTALFASTITTTATISDRRPSSSDRRPSSSERRSSSSDRRASVFTDDDGGSQVNELAKEVAQLRLKVTELESKLAGERQSRARAEAALARDSILIDKLTYDRARFLGATSTLRALALRNGAPTAAINDSLGSSGVAPGELDATGSHRASLSTKSSSLSSSSSTSSSTSSSSSSQLRARFRIDWADLQVQEQIGEGAASTVYYGQYRGQEVAIKVLKSLGNDDELKRDFWNECDIMRTLRTTDTVYFFGATAEPNVAIVLEYCARGSLFDAMRRPALQWPWQFVLRSMGQVATGLCALHGWKPAIVHRDLKSSNLMLDIHWKVKIGDFGVARFGGDERADDDVQGTYAYVAPELYHGNECTAAVDIYSFAVIMWEVVNRAVLGAYSAPYANERTLAQNFQILLLAALHNVRPTLPPRVPAEVRAIVEACWQSSPKSRPSAQRLVTMLDEAIAQEAQQRRKWARHLFTRGKGKPINSDL